MIWVTYVFFIDSSFVSKFLNFHEFLLFRICSFPSRNPSLHWSSRYSISFPSKHPTSILHLHLHFQFIWNLCVRIQRCNLVSTWITHSFNGIYWIVHLSLLLVIPTLLFSLNFHLFLDSLFSIYSCDVI